MALDYASIGFRCGVECHQRLATKEKLFCSCRNEISEEKPIGELRRRLRAVPSELGEYDPAALFEVKRGREFVYKLFEGSTCLVECDEEPPHEMNEEALAIALEVALLLNAKPVSEVHVMRKTVVDGSACSGFQRTALVALGGLLETSRGPVAIQTICLEEESSGIVSSSPKEVVYRLDRQGIPLIEIATSSDVRDAEHAREVAEKLGALLRSTAKVQRGIGTIRQDLNVSVKGGEKVEVKGAQEPELLPNIIENEVRRQLALLELEDELQRRGFKPPKPLKQAAVDVSKAFRKTECKIIGDALSRGDTVMALKLPKFAGLLGRELMPGHRLGTELFHYARAATGVKGIIHSDEDLRKYGVSEAEATATKKALACSEEDAFVLCAAPAAQAEAALDKMFERAAFAASRVPGETRKAEGELTVFMRPLPGPARMYPETDVPPAKVEAEALERISRALPALPEERRERYLALGLSEQLAARMLSSTVFELFEELVEETKADATLVATTLLETLRNLRREGLKTETISRESLCEALKLFKKGKVVRHAVSELLAEVARSKGKLSPHDAVKKLGIARATPEEVKKLVEKSRRKGVEPSEAFNEIMRLHRLRIAPEDLRKALGLG